MSSITLANVAGTLYIVATPIGNLEDITYRAARVLREVDLIACEDTRHTRRLLGHLGIEKPAISYHEHNELTRVDELLEKLRTGQNIALVADAGTPLISDPGYRIVSAAAKSGIHVVPVPGPSALLAALSASGLPTDSFYFGGFLPAKPNQRRNLLKRESLRDSTLVFYEAPHRILGSLEDIASALPNRPVVVARELTKLHEDFLRGDPIDIARQLAERSTARGEITIVIGKLGERPRDLGSVREAFSEYVAGGMSRMDAIKAVARDRGVSKREIYAELEAAGEG